MKSAIREIELRQNQPRLTPPRHFPLPPLPDGSSACSILPLSFPLLLRRRAARRLKCQGASGRFFRAETTKPNRSDRPRAEHTTTSRKWEDGNCACALSSIAPHTHSLPRNSSSLSSSSVRSWSRRRRWRRSIRPPPTTEMTAAATKSHSLAAEGRGEDNAGVAAAARVGIYSRSIVLVSAAE